jgi:hypothetical protein
MTDKQSEALWLADELDKTLDFQTRAWSAAKELRRLDALNAELVEAVKAALSDDQPYIERCKAALAKAEGK